MARSAIDLDMAWVPPRSKRGRQQRFGDAAIYACHHLCLSHWEDAVRDPANARSLYCLPERMRKRRKAVRTDAQKGHTWQCRKAQKRSQYDTLGRKNNNGEKHTMPQKSIIVLWYQGDNGGETGIRTLGGLAPTTVFETAPFDHSGTSPRGSVRQAFNGETCGVQGGIHTIFKKHVFYCPIPNFA